MLHHDQSRPVLTRGAIGILLHAGVVQAQGERQLMRRDVGRERFYEGSLHAPGQADVTAVPPNAIDHGPGKNDQ